MHEPIAFWTLAIVVSTCLFSFAAFRNRDIEERFIFCPEDILACKQYRRLITSAFLHVDGRHLLFNMITLYLFGEDIEFVFGAAQLLVIYFASILGGSLLSLFMHRNHHYRACGASGGVSGLILASIFLFPGGNISLLFIPFGIPSWLYAIIFLAASFYGMKSGKDNVGHDAHLGGAIVGFAITALLHPRVIQTSPLLFWVVLAGSVLMLFFLLRNPLFLPLHAFQEEKITWPTLADLRPPKSEKLKIDSLLDKVSEQGIDSLSLEERAFLDGISEKYRRRAESKKPEWQFPF
jgi:membrane associated rhomboid family serine protease